MEAKYLGIDPGGGLADGEFHKGRTRLGAAGAWVLARIDVDASPGLTKALLEPERASAEPERLRTAATARRTQSSGEILGDRRAWRLS